MNKKLKKIMTDLAAGHITEKEAEKLTKDNTHKRKGSIKTREEKK